MIRPLRLRGRTAEPDLLRRALALEYATIAWNALEGVVTIAAGIIAGSIALVAFGLDSAVEVFASAVVVWSCGAPTAVASGSRCG